MSLKFFQKILPAAKQVNVFDQKVDPYLANIMEYIDSLKDPATQDSIDQSIRGKNNAQKEIIYGKSVCTICSITFENHEAQREHFKLDWHRYNVKQQSLGRQISSEEMFEEQISGEVSSISASDSSESEEDLEPFFNKYNREISEEEKQMNEKSLFSQHPTKNFYITKDDTLVSFYKNVIALCPQSVGCERCFCDVTLQLKRSCVWVYLMLSAGHFAGVVFEKSKVIEHKTFHRYTVRAKRGTIQSVQDKKQGNAKSAGASIRRYNEAALAQDIQKLIDSWASYIKKADKIFYKCSTYHMNIIFGEKTVLSRDDHRVSKISIMTKRPTFKEVQRIHQLFSYISIYDKVSMVEDRIKKETPLVKKVKTEKEGKMGEIVSPLEKMMNQFDIDSIDEEEEEEDHQLSKQKTKKKNKKNKAMKEKEEKKMSTVVNEDEQLWNELYFSLKNQNLEEMKNFLSPPLSITSEHVEAANALDDSKTTLDDSKTTLDDSKNILGDPKDSLRHNTSGGFEQSDTLPNTEHSKVQPTSELSKCKSSEYGQQDNKYFSPDWKRKRLHFLENNYLNFCSPEHHETFLHVAVQLNNRGMVWGLLEAGADPSIINSQGKVPYDIANEKETRNEFRRFMAKFPEKYDYKTAKIPSPLSEELEAEQRRKSSEKKKQQQKARKERLKAKKAVEQQEKAAEQERKQFDALSDREKRAVMAERRFAVQLTNSLRCSNCRNAMDEKNTFQRFEYKYCSTDCVHQHKKIIGK